MRESELVFMPRCRFPSEIRDMGLARFFLQREFMRLAI